MKNKFLLCLGALLLLFSTQSWGTYYFKGSFNSWGTDNPCNSDGYTVVNLEAKKSYTFKVFSDGSNKWYGNKGTMKNTCQGWTFESDKDKCTIETSVAGPYLFYLSSSDKKVSVFYPDGTPYWFNKGAIVYFDNTLTNFEKVYLRVGRTDYNSAYLMTEKVSGTQNLYKYSLPFWANYAAFTISNNCSWIGSHSIYTNVHSDKYDVTASIVYKNKSILSSVTYVASSIGDKGSDNCQYYNMQSFEGLLTQQVTIKALAGGSTISVSYTDENNVAQVKQSQADQDVVFNVAQTCILTVSVEKAAGQTVTLTVNGDEFTSGNIYVTRSTTTIAAVAETYYDVTVVDNAGEAVKQASNVHSNSATAADKEDWKFVGWTVEPAANIQWINCTEADKTIEFKAIGAATITANYEELPKIYFDNSIGWDNVYVYFNAYWDTYNNPSHGAGAKDKPYGQMKQIGETNRYYYAYDVPSPSVQVAFSNVDMHTYGNFHKNQAVYRADFDVCRPVFTPDATAETKTYNETKYHNTGYWQTHDTHTGMYLVYGINDNDPTWSRTPEQEFIRESITATRGMMTITLTEGNTYKFKIRTCAGLYYGNTGTITTNISLESSGWEFNTGTDNCKIVANKTGEYTFYYDFYSRRLWVLYPAYYLKHAWTEGDHTWTWKYCDIYNADSKTYSLYATYEGTGVNYNTKAADATGHYCTVDNGKLTLIGDPQVGKPARFTFDPLTETATIENMYFPITMNKYGYGTLYHKENLQIPDGVTAKYVIGTEGILLSYQQVEGGVIPKNTGVMLFAEKNTFMEFVGVAEATDEVPANIMSGSHDAEVVNNSDIHYILTTDDAGQVGMFWPYGTYEGVGTFTNAANKAYIYLPSETEQPASVCARKGFLLTNEQNTPTDMQELKDKVKVEGTFIVNGHLLIRKDGRLFNAQGKEL